MEVLPKPHHTALTLLFLLADKTVYDVDDQISITRAVVLHADMVCYWANTTAVTKFLQKVLKTLLLFYTTRNHFIHHRHAATSKVNSDKGSTLKLKILSISEAQYLRNTLN